MSKRENSREAAQRTRGASDEKKGPLSHNPPGYQGEDRQGERRAYEQGWMESRRDPTPTPASRIPKR